MSMDRSLTLHDQVLKVCPGGGGLNMRAGLYKLTENKDDIVHTTRSDKHGVFFWYPVKSDLSIVRFSVQPYTGQFTFTRYQKHTAMYNWSPCRIILTKSIESLKRMSRNMYIVLIMYITVKQKHF